MDASTVNERKVGKRATEPKHGKDPMKRLYSKWRRGPAVKEEVGDGTINPDASIKVATVCGSDVRIFAKAKAGRSLYETYHFDNHGQAVQFAAEYDEAERRARETSRSDNPRVFTPFFQVKVAGRVVDHTNARERAHIVLKDGAAKPKELWRINEGGSAELLEMVA